MSLLTLSANESNWVSQACAALKYDGCAIVTDAVPNSLIAKTGAALYRARAGIYSEIGIEKLEQAGELGTIRLPMKFDPTFFEFLELPTILSIVDATVGETAILHQQNGFVLPSLDGSLTPTTFQNTFHRDFPRHLNGYLASINVFVTVDAFTSNNGATLVAPGTHQRAEAPPRDYLERRATEAIAPAGSLLLFDSTLWHAAGHNLSGKDRLALNHQFTRSFFKQQVDYVRALGDLAILARPERTQQLLGWHTRVVTNLDEYYRPAHERLYRSGQG